MPVPTLSGPSPRSVKAVRMQPERLWRKGFVREMSFKSGVKGRGSDSGESEGGDCNEDAQDEVNQEESEQVEVDGTEEGSWLLSVRHTAHWQHLWRHHKITDL